MSEERFKVLELAIQQLTERISELEELIHELQHVVYEIPCDECDGNDGSGSMN